jgi:hypothetical protein
MANLGLTPADTEALVNDVDMIIHCAADIRLEACIQVTNQCYWSHIPDFPSRCLSWSGSCSCLGIYCSQLIWIPAAFCIFFNLLATKESCIHTT